LFDLPAIASRSGEAGIALEAHIIVEQCNLQEMERIKLVIKNKLQEAFGITHSTLEFEPELCEDDIHV
jgi:cobalt-zinc-cadmium efflux system protein